MNDRDARGSGIDPRLIVKPGVFTGLLLVFTVAIIASVISKIAFGWAAPIAPAFGVAAILSVALAWVVFVRSGVTAVGQRGVLALCLLGMALINADLLIDTALPLVHRANALMWWVVAGTFGYEWLRHRRLRARMRERS